MNLSREIFRQYDVRGIVGRDLTAGTAYTLGRAYAAYLANRGHSGPVAIGRDNRPSGDELRDALVRGLTESGLDVIDIGQVPTPLLYWSLNHLAVAGGIQVTGSHNPPEYNGFKLSLGTASIHGEEIQEIYRLAVAGKFPAGKGSVRTREIIDAYVDDIVARTGPLQRRLKVVVDCGNGVGALVAPKLFDRDDEASYEHLSEPRGHRAIGVVYDPRTEHWGNYVPTILPQRYDAFLYIEETTAVDPLHMAVLVDGEPPETYPSGE